MTSRENLVAQLSQLRPELHRYCSRMTGSTFDGEDVVQDVLIRALAAVDDLSESAALRPWIFRIAHNRTIDFLRSKTVRSSQPLEAATELSADSDSDSLESVARSEAVNAAVSRFTQLPIAQRSSIILKDVLGHSLLEVGELLNLSVDAVKAALARGRASLKSFRSDGASAERTPSSPEATRFATLFNQRDWDGLRNLLAEDVHLSQTARAERRGRSDVSIFFTIYATIPSFHLVPARLDGGQGAEVIAVFTDPKACEPGYFMQVQWNHGEIVSIRDFKYAAYVLEGADLLLCSQA